MVALANAARPVELSLAFLSEGIFSKWIKLWQQQLFRKTSSVFLQGTSEINICEVSFCSILLRNSKNKNTCKWVCSFPFRWVGGVKGMLHGPSTSPADPYDPHHSLHPAPSEAKPLQLYAQEHIQDFILVLFTAKLLFHSETSEVRKFWRAASQKSLRMGSLISFCTGHSLVVCAGFSLRRDGVVALLRAAGRHFGGKKA